MKAGTTTLYEYLRGHPEVGMSREKETDFFVAGRGWDRGLPWYHAQFTPGRRIYGEASPNYSKYQAFPGVPERVAQLIPQVKLIYITRHPLERAKSQYRHAILSGETVPPPDKLIGSHHLKHLIDCGSYAAQLDQWQSRFPEHQILNMQFESLIKNPTQSLGALANFLQISNNWKISGEIAANSGESLARLPPWLFTLRKMPITRWIKQALPTEMRGQLKKLVMARNIRPAPTLPPLILRSIQEATWADTQRYLASSGIQFSEPKKWLTHV